MDNNDQLASHDHVHLEEGAYDYNREPEPDETTISENRGRSKYVFTTLCFLLALLLGSTYITHPFAIYDGDWFPLIGAIVLAIMGIVFLRSPNTRPATQATSDEAAPLITRAKAASETALSPFEKLVQEALATVPDEFHARMEKVAIHVAYEPDEATLRHVGANEGYTLLGLYEGVPLTVYGHEHAAYPEVITIYQRTIEDYCQGDPERIREQVRATVLHEIAHYFGIGHEQMPIWIK